MSKNAKRSESPPISVSQNFLTSAKTIRRLLRLTTICERDHVIEIGAGKGHITRELVKVCRFVSAYEIDAKLYGPLRQRLGCSDQLNLMNHDFLRASLPKNTPYKVFSNIPFSITADIVRKLTDADNPPQEAWLVMEKGAAKRFSGKPRDTLCSIRLKSLFDMKIVYHFSGQDFHPAPSVEIVLLQLSKKKPPDIPTAQQKSFDHFVGKCLRYGLYSQLTKRQVSTALKRAELPLIPESGTILYIQWLCLFRCWRQKHGCR